MKRKTEVRILGKQLFQYTKETNQDNTKKEKQSQETVEIQTTQPPEKHLTKDDLHEALNQLNTQEVQKSEEETTTESNTLPEEVEDDEQVEEKEKHVCDECGERFDSINGLNGHLKAHKNKEYTCNKCDTSFDNPGGLGGHSCENYREESAEKSKSTDSAISVDRDEKTSFDCPQCSKSFDSKQSLSSHHTAKEDHIGLSKFFEGDDGNYYCGHCGKVFEEVRNLSNHVFGKHDDTLVEYYVENFSDLKKNKRVDGVYNSEGNIPELNQLKHVTDYEKFELKSILRDHLEGIDHAQTIKQVGRTLFDQELESTMKAYNKVYSSLQDLDEVSRMKNPNGMGYVYFHESNREEV